MDIKRVLKPSHISNFFKDKPTDLHLEFGLRFNW